MHPVLEKNICCWLRNYFKPIFQIVSSKKNILLWRKGFYKCNAVRKFQNWLATNASFACQNGNTLYLVGGIAIVSNITAFFKLNNFSNH